MNRAAQLVQNLMQVQAAITAACRRSGRNAQNIALMAVTKYAADEDVLALLSGGHIRHIGESRAQQAIARWTRPEFAALPVVKHFIGHVQRNKAALVAQYFDFVDSIDDIRTAQSLHTAAQRLQKPMQVLVQIKLTDRDTQSGVSLAEAPALVQELAHWPYLRPCGYMAIAPQVPHPDTLRPLFKQVKEAFEQDFPPTVPQRYLSLGMSHDFETAVEEGSTLPRVGSRLFAAHLEEV